jgi:pentatricopeptide repeat protein
MHKLDKIAHDQLISSPLPHARVPLNIVSTRLQNQVEEAKAIFASVRNPDKIAYDQYINLLAKAGRAQDACHALEAMKAHGIEISHYAYSGVVLAYCNSGGDDGVLRKEKIMCFLKVGFGDFAGLGSIWVWRRRVRSLCRF